MRHIEAIGWEVCPPDPLAMVLPVESLVFTVRANAFLKRMVRNLVGTLLAVGRGDWQPDDVRSALVAQDRSRSGPPVPPHGLVLERVDYAAYPHLFSNG